MDKENTNQNITPVFWDENDGKWHFTEKCLNPEFQITYVTNPHTFETQMRRCKLIWDRRRNFPRRWTR